MRPGAVAAVALVSAVVGVLGALSIGKASGWVGGTETVVVAPAPRSGDPAAAPLRTVAKPLVSGAFDPAKIYAARANGVVTIYAFFGSENDAQSVAQGSGFVVSRDGLVLTNSHVVTNAGEGEPLASAKAVYVQFHDGDRVTGRIVGYDPFTDVAVVRLNPKDHRLRPVPLGDSARVVVGEPVAAIGTPFGNETSLAVGVISATHRSIDSLTSIYNVVDAIQTDAPINRGNSGGPLFDARGRVIGINAQIRSDTGANEGVGFAIPINAAKRSLEQLVATGSVHYAYVGVSTADLTPSLARRFGYSVQRGAAITDVRKASPAAHADLRAGTREEQFNGIAFPVGGDVIVGIDDLKVRGADDVVRYVSERLKPGEVAIFTVIRGGKERNIAVTLGERPLPR
ncbi:MAG TPA: trypsin-like peptidase domain-containing protein [Gaiellaceae bacterium]|jgi:S1-C subfamily serine protease|nr:trypsin-like peptidase domain-containing protein [Gaiellaceae bacterium]